MVSLLRPRIIAAPLLLLFFWTGALTAQSQKSQPEVFPGAVMIKFQEDADQFSSSSKNKNGQSGTLTPKNRVMQAISDFGGTV